MSQSLAVPSKDPDTIWSPSDEKFKLITSPECPLKVQSSWPVSTSHSFPVVSMDPVASIVACGSNVRHTISPVWPFSVVTQFPLFVSQILAVLSKEPVAMRSLVKLPVPKGIVERQAINYLLMSGQGEYFLTTLSVPQLTRPVIAPRNKPYCSRMPTCLHLC